MLTQEAIDWIRNRWIPALRGGAYKQGVGQLRRDDNTFCCLGVACDLATDEGILPDWEVSPDYVMQWVIPSNALGDACALSIFPDIMVEFLEMGTMGNVSVPVGDRDFVYSTLAAANDNDTPFSVVADALEAWCAEQEALLCQPNQ